MVRLTATLLALLQLVVVIDVVLVRGWSPPASAGQLAGASHCQNSYRHKIQPLISVVHAQLPQSEAPLLVVENELSVEDGEDKDEDEEEEEGKEVLWQDYRTNGTAVCRICATADGEIPISDQSVLPPTLVRSDLFGKMDAIYHAASHADTSSLKYINSDKRRRQRNVAGTKGGDDGSEDVENRFDEEEEVLLVSILRSSLEDAGFELLNRRDLDLCEALNAAYLLRLSIQPDIKTFDPKVGQEFYPERFGFDKANGSDNKDTAGAGAEPTEAFEKHDLLFDGRVLIFRRGYSEEVTVGRLLLPKLDYLQASIVQKSAAIVTRALSRIERSVVNTVARVARSTRRRLREVLSDMADAIPATKVTAIIKSRWVLNETSSFVDGNETNGSATSSNEAKILKLNRYGGSREQFVAAPDLNDAINPFLICEVEYAHEVPLGSTNGNTPTDDKGISGPMIEAVNTGTITCEYDARNQKQGSLNEPMRLLKRVSISNLIDFFSPQGRRGVVRGFVEKAKLVEPTYSEVVVVWRPLPEKSKKEMTPPRALIEVAEIFGIEDKLPKKMKRRKAASESKAMPPLKIRAFTDVPMANLPAVLPKTKLVFRPADAFVFDTISLFSLGAVLASQRFDNPKFDLIAIVSVSLWIIRTFFRYSNKFARYDLLVNKFLTSRISYRGPGALRYLASEAASQKAARVGLLHTWLRQLCGYKLPGKEEGVKEGKEGEDGTANGTNVANATMSREEMLERGSEEMNSLLSCDRFVKINTKAALRDLEDLGGIYFDGGLMTKKLLDEKELRLALKSRWNDIIDE